MCFAPQRRALFQHPNLQKRREHVVFCTFWLGNVLRTTTACTFSTSQLPKVVRDHGVPVFNTFYFQMCFAPQRRVLFRHRNFQKWSDHGVFCTFWSSKCTKHTMVGPLLEVAMSKKYTPLWREAHLEVKSVKNWRSRSTFGSWDVEKVHAVVARSTFRSENVQNTWVSEHFWKLRCRKSARRCGAKHISKSTC